MSNIFNYLAQGSDESDHPIENDTPSVESNDVASKTENIIKNEKELKVEAEEKEREVQKNEGQKEGKNLDPDHPTPEQIKNCPTVFQALGMDENRKVLYTFIGISLSLVFVGFGSFYLGKKIIPIIFPSIDPFDAPIYSCGLAVVLTQLIIFAFYFWAWDHDVAEEKKEKELEEQKRKESLQKKLKHD